MKKHFKFKKLFFSIGLLLVTLFTLTSIGSVSAADNTADYSIDKAWVYPVRPSMDEWNTYFTPDQKLKASYVPEGILKNMTTEALVETVLNYPLLIDIYAFNTLEAGYKVVSSNFYGLPELESRPDAIKTLNNYIEKNFHEKDNVNMVYYFANRLIDCIEHNTTPMSPKHTSTHVHTPVGTEVAAWYGVTWNDLGYTQAEAEDARDEYLITYPSTVVVGPVDSEYNCHSYAWYWASTSNGYWIENPSAYMTDGSYESCAAYVGAKVFYNSTGTSNDHSGIIIQTASYPNPCVVQSKWGGCALFTHYVDDCPYANYYPTVTCWGPS